MTSASYRNFTGTGAQNYQRYFVPAIAEPVSADLLRTADLQAGERVVDVACGTGVIARRAAEQVGPTGSVIGIDVAPDMIEVAESAPPPAGSRVEWYASDAASLPLADESCDVVLCQMGLCSWRTNRQPWPRCAVWWCQAAVSSSTPRATSNRSSS